MTTRQEFLIKEYESLKSEIRGFSDELNTLMRYSIIFMGAIFSIIFYKNNNGQPVTIKKEYEQWLIWFPFIFNFLLAFRFMMIGFFIQEISEYIETVEKNLLKNRDNENKEGWETHLNSKVRKKGWLKLMIMSIPSIIFWFIVLLLSLIFALYFQHVQPK